MPRPPLKRHKPGLQSPKGRVGSQKNAQVRQLLDRKLASKPVGQRPADSDDSDRLVTQTPHARSRTSNLHREIYASGAIGQGDKPGAYPTRAQRRRNLQNDTEQILRESRSRSSSASASKTKSVSPKSVEKASLKPGKDNTLRVAAETKPPRIVARPSGLENLPKLCNTPLAENSMLGTLKPRKRQASILHLIDNEDSSLIDPDDEDRFLPDDESTPLHGNKTHTAGLSTPATSISRKRKLNHHISESARPIKLVKATTLPPHEKDFREETTLPVVSDHTNRRTPISQSNDVDQFDDDDVMALPHSSSPEASPRPSVKKGRTATAVPSTQQLQSLMPSKRRKGTRQRKQASEFDIPEGTSSDLPDDNDESIYVPKHASVRGNRSATSSRNVRTLPKPVVAKAKNHKSTTPTSLRPSNVSTRTPIPLTRSINAENRKLSSPFLQHDRTGIGKDPGFKQSGKPGKGAIESGKLFGGSLRKSMRQSRSTRSGMAAEADRDQENLDNIKQSGLRFSNILDEDRTKAHSGELPASGGLTGAEELTADVADDDDDADQTANDHNVEESMLAKKRTAVQNSVLKSDLAKSWKSKWADIDEWSLDYEEVDVSNGGSSPMRR